MTMYGTIKGVKQNMGIALSADSQLSEILREIEHADSWVDSMFTQFGQSVPSTTPTAVKEASNSITAYYMLRVTKPDTAARFLDDGRRELLDYLHANYKRGTATLAGSERFDTET